MQKNIIYSLIIIFIFEVSALLLFCDFSGMVSRTAFEQKQQSRKVDINKASLRDLEELPGIGYAYAKRIIEFRDTKGGINKIEELLEVKGIGKKRLENLKKCIYVKKS